MKPIIRFLIPVLFVSVSQFIGVKAYSQTAEEVQRAEWIFNIAWGVTWQDEANVTVYTIGVFSSKAEYDQIKGLAANKTIKGKPVEVVRYTNYTDIEANHIVYVTRSENAYLGFVYEMLKGKNVLIMSDRSKQPEFSVINFNKIDESSQKFELNMRLGEAQGLAFSTQIQKLGGDRDVLQKIYAETNRKLLEEQKILEEKRKEIEDKEKLLVNQEKRIQAQRDSIQSKENLIRSKESEILKQNRRLDSMSFEVMQQRDNLKRNMVILMAQTDNINKQRDFAKKLREQVVKDSIASVKVSEELAEREKALGESEQTVASQRTVIYFAIAAIIIFIILGILIIRSYINKQKINKQLSEQYVAINSQKNEIQTQAKQLESANTELEKLSIVASETDNAVTIMDVNGNFEWVNAGFTRMYGYTLQLLRNELDYNIMTASKNPEVKRVIDKIIETKQTGSYQNLSKTRRGKEIWAQTTITPILNDNNEVVKLISIDTDITVEKKAELEIRKQKEQIEFQNEQISSSINYAKNIQQAILPLPEDLEKFFESFVIFRPRDVVSGDFYWMAYLPARENLSEKLFLASVDCTGHGVPGAFMSMIGSRILNEIVIEQKVTDPKTILEMMDDKVKFALRQETTDNNDGMDLALCKIEKEHDSYHITYSGAKVDMYYYSHKNEGVTILSSERRSIGGAAQKRGNVNFTNKDFYLGKGDQIWLITDGIIDQSNPERKRFGTPKLVETFEEAKGLSLSGQKQLIEKELALHQEHEEQRDDITIWGVKFTEKW
jgi:PAS domain S-box-containing protein